MNDTLLRHWHMLREIPRHPRKISTVELKQRLSAAGYVTTLRTIQRDLIKLSDALPLLGDEASPQGWSWEAHAPQMDFPTLEPQAALVFHLADRYLQSLLPASTLDYLSPWFRTATGVLDNQGNGLSAWRNKVRVLAPGQPLLPPTIDAEIQATITKALLTNKRIAVKYRPLGSQEDKEYDASPLGLVVRDQMIYLICTLREYSNVKMLVLNRMQSAELLDMPARELPEFDLDAYIKQGSLDWLRESDNTTLRLVANCDRKVARLFIEQPLEANQLVEDVDDKTVRLTATVADTYVLRRWLRGFGCNIEVLEPNELRIEIKATIDGMLERYLSNI